MKRLLFIQVLFLMACSAFSQSVGIGTTTPNSSAALDITSSAKGLLIPRMSTSSINAIPNPARGLLVYDSVTNQLKLNTGNAAAPNWQQVVSGNNSTGWSLTGNSGTNPSSQFIGSSDNQPLRFRVNNIPAGELHPVTGNVFWGLRAGFSNTTGFSNIAIGTDALKSNAASGNLVAIGDSALFNNGPGSPFSLNGTSNVAIGSKSLFANTIGSSNTAVGEKALQFNTTGFGNTATGVESLSQNTTGINNTAIGRVALFNNTTGRENTSCGSFALFSNTNGIDNTAVGFNSLSDNLTGSNNTANGFNSLAANTTGSSNIAFGAQSLSSNTTGGNNTGVGFQSLISNITGTSNTGIGNDALFLNTSGSSNTAIGEFAMGNNIDGHFNVAIGQNALLATFSAQENTAIGFNAASRFNLGFNNTIIGAEAGVSKNDLFNCVALGRLSTCTASSQVRLGNSFTTSIGGIVGYSNLSDGRYKKNVQETVKGIDFIMQLRPVTYQLDIDQLNNKLYSGRRTADLFKKETDENATTIFSGFVAQEVEQAAKNAGYNFSGVDKPKNDNDFYGLRYAEFVVPLVKAVQEQQRTIQEQKLVIEDLKKQNADFGKRLQALEKAIL